MFNCSQNVIEIKLQDIHAARLDNNKNLVGQNVLYPGGNNLNNEESRPLSRVNLRDNQLKGSIILGNYGVIILLYVSLIFNILIFNLTYFSIYRI